MSLLPGRAAFTEVAWVVAGQAAAVIGSLALLRLLTTIMTPDEYGRLALGLTLAGLVGQAMTGGVANGIGRFRSIAVESGGLGDFVHAARRMAIRTGGLVLASGLLLAGALFLVGRPEWAWIVVWTVPFATFSGWNQMLLAYQGAARRRPIVAVFSALEQWLRLPAAWLLATWFRPDAATMIAALSVASLAAVVAQAPLVERAGSRSPEAERDWIRRMNAFARPFMLFGIFTWMQQASDRWALEAIASTRDVAAFAVLFQIGYAPLSMLSSLAMSVIGPVLYQRAGDAASAERIRRVRATIRRLCGGVLLLTAIGTAAGFFLRDFIFALLVGPEFRDAAPLLPWMVAAAGLFAAGQVLSLGLMAEVDTARLIRPMIVNALVGVVLYVVCAAWAGVTVVAIDSCVFGLVYLAWIAMLVRSAPGPRA